MNTYPFKQRRIDPLISFDIQNLETDTLSSTDVTATTLVATNANISSNVNLVTNIQGGSTGQIPYQSSSGTTSFFGPGSSGQVYKTSSTTLPTTSTVSMSTNVQNILPVSKGGTGSSSLSTITVGSATNLSGGAIGSLPTQSASDTTTFVSPGAANTSLVSQGVSSLPTYQTIGGVIPTVRLYTTSPSTTNYQPASNVKWIEFYVIGNGGNGPNVTSNTARLGGGGGAGGILYHILGNVPQLPTGTVTLSSSAVTFAINSLTFTANNGQTGSYSTTVENYGGNSGSTSGTTPMIRYYGEAGSVSDNSLRLGGGGSSMFGTGGRQFKNTNGSTANGENGSGLGGGGGCSMTTSGLIGQGATGGVVIIEHY